jgi:hypothetical protein
MNLAGPLVWDPILTDQKGSLTSPDPLGAGPAASNPQGKAPLRPTLGARGPSCPTPWKGFRFARPEGCGVGLGRGLGLLRGPHRPLTAMNAGCGPEIMPLTLWRGRVRLDVTGGRHRLCLGTRVPNSVKRISTVLLDPRATLDKGIY